MHIPALYPASMAKDAPSAGRFDGRAHLLPVRIYYEDTDFTGVVYHANYLRYFERGRSDFLRLAGVSHQALLQSDKPSGFSVVAMELKFLRAARVDDGLIVKTTFDAVKGPRLQIAQSLWRGEEAIADAAVTACCIDLSGRAIRPPEALKACLKPFLDPSLSSF